MDLGWIVARDGSHEYTSMSQGWDWASSPVCLIKKVQWLAIGKDFSWQIGRTWLSVLMGTLGTHLSSAQRPKFASLSLRGREAMAFSVHENIADFLRSSVPS